jgi:putative ABC transport system substrate-binding protein
MTGVAFTSDEATYSKTLEILKEAVPTAARVAVLLGQANSVTMEAIDAAILGLKIKVEPHVATEPEHLDAALTAVRRSKVDALYVPPSGLTYQYRKKIVSFAASSRLPTVYPFSEAVEEGGLLSFGASQVGMAQQAAGFVARILRGARPGDLPVEQPTKYDLLINLKTAKPRSEPRSADGRRSVLPMEVQVGDRLTEAGFEWEVGPIRRPCTAARTCARGYGARDFLRPSAT